MSFVAKPWVSRVVRTSMPGGVHGARGSLSLSRQSVNNRGQEACGQRCQRRSGYRERKHPTVRS